jgi:xanthine dehydrogenase accessory factor
MSFTDAVFDGKVSLEGVLAKRIDRSNALHMLTCRQAIPVVVDDIDHSVCALQPDALVDARMRKRVVPEVQRHHASLTIGLGPNFIAGDQTHVVVETAWGDHLGEIITHGSSQPLSGEPKMINGIGRERCVYAPCEGVLRTGVRIGQWLNQGSPVGILNQTPVFVPIDGYVRGICRDGLHVEAGTKLLEMDPREKNDGCYGLGERPLRIAQGVARTLGYFS